MHQAEGRRDRISLSIGIGLGLILVYALPVFIPPPPTAYVAASRETSTLARLFPQVPAWWVIGRLLALLGGAALIASTSRHPVVRLPLRPRSAAPASARPWVPRVALLAALIQIACLPFVRQLPYFVKTLYVLWMFVPAGILAWKNMRYPLRVRPVGRKWQQTTWCTGALVVFWIVARLALSWHSPVAADSVDMFRTLGGLRRLAATGADFMTESMGMKEGMGDIEVRGVNAVQLFFSGLPLLRATSHSPCLWWMQVVNVIWLTAAALVIVALGRFLIGSVASTTAMAAFLFSPFLLMVQILPIPSVEVFFAALLVLLPLIFYQTGSPVVLTLFAGIAGFTTTLPSLTCMTGLALAFVTWRVWRGPRVPSIAVLTAMVSFVAVLTPNLPSEQALRDARDWYVLKHWPMAIGERALQGQISPTIADWTTVDPPGFFLIALGTLLSPFAIPRQPLKLWGDTLYEPLSAGLSAVGLAVCLRYAVRDRVSLYLLAFLAASLIPGLVSSYDRPSLTRVYGAMVPLSILSAAGLVTVMATIRSAAVREWVTILVAVAIAISGMFIFDVVNPRILSASTFGLLMRSVDDALLDKVAMLTAEGRPLTLPDTAYNARHWDADWLRSHHPYIDDLASCAPRHPVPIIPIQHPERLADKDLLFWSPALEQTTEITQRHICRLWPNAVLYTIVDRAGLSRLYGAQIHGPEWTPSVPARQWSTRRCGESG